MDAVTTGSLTCPLCGRRHSPVRLRVGERALCVDCGSPIARGTVSANAAPAFTLTAVLLAFPALQQPLVHVHKFGADRASYLWSGARGLWENGMPLLSVWVALCGIVVPVALIATLAVCAGAPYLGQPLPPGGVWMRAAHALQHWSMPEVHILAVLVAFVKIGVLVDVAPGLGLWFYAAMSLATLLAWRSTELQELQR